MNTIKGFHLEERLKGLICRGETEAGEKIHPATFQ
jgi:hypothetical protein